MAYARNLMSVAADAVIDFFGLNQPLQVDKYFPNWRDYENPKSYVLPIGFSYKNAIISDQAIENIQIRDRDRERKHLDSVIVARRSDDAECLAYDALHRAAFNSIKAPFVAVHGFAMNKKTFEKGNFKGRAKFQLTYDRFIDELRKVPQKEKANDFELDFLLIGKHIGVVIVEVKSSPWLGKNAKVEFKKGISQLNSIGPILRMMQELLRLITGKEVDLPPSNAIRKILFNPNFEKSNLASLKIRNEQIDSIELIFKEDVDFEKNSTSMVKAIENLLTNDQLLTNVDVLSAEVYEAYAALITGLAFMAGNEDRPDDTALSETFRAFGQTGQRHDEKKVPRNNVSQKTQSEKTDGGKTRENAESKSKNTYEPDLSRTAELVSGHEYQENSIVDKKSLLIKPPKNMLPRLKFITTDQDKVLKGPNRLVCLGVAGCGKTILLQAKAAELLRRNQNDTVIVLASKNYRLRYKMFFDEHKLNNYRIGTLVDFVSKITDGMKIRFVKEEIKDNKIVRTVDISEVLDKHREELHRRLRNVVSSKDHVFIDDALSVFENQRQMWLSLLVGNAIGELIEEDRYIWIAMDPDQHANLMLARGIEEGYFDLAGCSQLLIPTNNTISASTFTIGYLTFPTSGCTVFTIHEVMRCCEQVMDGYNCIPLSKKIISLVSPIAGHKLPGIQPGYIDQHFRTSDQAWAELANTLPDIVRSMIRLSKQTENLIGVVATGIFSDWQKILNILKRGCEEIYATDVKRFYEYKDQDAADRSVQDTAVHTYDAECVTADMPPLACRASVLVTDIDHIQSFEWPVVIHVVGWEKSQLVADRNPEFLRYAKFLTRSRAVVTFLELMFTFDKN